MSPSHRDTHPPGTSRGNPQTTHTHTHWDIHPTSRDNRCHLGTHPPGTLTREHPSIWGQPPILSLTLTRVRAAPSHPVPILFIHDPQGHWHLSCPVPAFPVPSGCPLSPKGVPIPMSPVASRCPYPCYYVPCLHGMSPLPYSLCSQSIPISLGCPHFHGPSPLVCFLFLWCVPCPLLPQHMCVFPCCPWLPKMSPSPQRISLVPLGVLIPRFCLPGEIPCLSGVFPSSPRCSHPKSPVTPGVSLVPPSPQRVVPEDADGLGALLGLQKPELESDRFGQHLGGPRAPHVIGAPHVHADAHHRCVDDGALGHPEVHQG